MHEAWAYGGRKEKEEQKAKRNHRKATSPPVCRCLTTFLSVSDCSLSSFLNPQTSTHMLHHLFSLFLTLSFSSVSSSWEKNKERKIVMEHNHHQNLFKKQHSYSSVSMLLPYTTTTSSSSSSSSILFSHGFDHLHQVLFIIFLHFFLSHVFINPIFFFVKKNSKKSNFKPGLFSEKFFDEPHLKLAVN